MSSATVELTAGQRRLVLGIVGLGLVMVVSAVSGLNVALPDLALDTGATQTELQWIVDAYSIVFASLLLPFGALGDRYGRRTMLLVGLAIFGVGAFAAVFVSDPDALIACRAVMGVGAAFVMPATLSVITTSFPEDERGQAVGVWIGLAGAGAVIGLFASGLLLEWFSWNSFFVLNVALAVAALVGVTLAVPNSRDPSSPPFDLVGSLLALGGVAALVFGIIEGPNLGWDDPLVLAGLILGPILVVLFVLWELRRPVPMLDPRLFLLRGFGAGSASITIQFFAFFGFIFIVMQYLQFVVGYSALGAAVAILPFAVVMIPLSRKGPAIAARLGPNRVGAAGLVLMAAAMLVFTFLGTDLHYVLFALGLVLLAAGLALSSSPSTTAIVDSLPPAKQGVASAVNDTSRELGAALGIAVLGSILADRYAGSLEPGPTGLPPNVAAAIDDSVAAAHQAAAEIGGAQGAQLGEAANQAFVDGLRAASIAAGAVLLLGAVFVALRAPKGSESYGNVAIRPRQDWSGG